MMPCMILYICSPRHTTEMINNKMISSSSSTILTTHLLLILTTHLFTTSHSEKCNPDDKNALLQFKKQLGNPNQLSSWNPTTDCCNGTWQGVSCDTDTQTYRVNDLDLFSIDLPQPYPIPPSITNLPFLFYFSLSNIPNLVGTIPEFISNLTNLRYLYITQTNISGEIPTTLSQIKTLVTVDFSYNKLTGPLPATLSSLPNLVGITFDGNQLTGPIPEKIYFLLRH
uniref:Polygalacturonase inhibitor 2-like n=1 Tax=Cicer arietinum TaxID=3827 RepID=A0A1S3EAR9_CICAR|nr:polygalacturonase inhibitor 2-like [Cicer arietinum]